MFSTVAQAKKEKPSGSFPHLYRAIYFVRVTQEADKRRLKGKKEVKIKKSGSKKTSEQEREFECVCVCDFTECLLKIVFVCVDLLILIISFIDAFIYLVYFDKIVFLSVDLSFLACCGELWDY